MKKRVMVFGTFDLLHPGHRFLIEEALRLGSVTVIVARASNVERIKGRPPRENDETRVAALKEAFPDVTVLLGDEEDFLRPLRELKPDLLLFGYDQKLPPGVSESDLPCPVLRAPAFRPEVFKTSLMKEKRVSGD